jgi:hypothetical protein
MLTDPDNVDPLSGFPVFKALLCDVVPRSLAAAAGAGAATHKDNPGLAGQQQQSSISSRPTKDLAP